MFFVDFEAGLRNHNITFKLYACGCEKRIYEIKIHSKKRIWLKFALSCGKAGCLWELEMFFSKPDISKNSGLTTNCHTAQVQTSTRALSSKPTFTPKFKVPGKYKEASTRYLTSADLEKKSAWELRVMRNEIFARYYYIFKTTPMRNYFIQQPWYIPLYNDVSSKLTDIELANIKLIQKYEKKISK
jgi:hypothetical protein